MHSRAWAAAAAGSLQTLWGLAWFKALAGATGLALASLAASGGAIDPAAIAAVIRDPGSILDQRSPGARGAGALTLTKRGRTAAADVFPTTPHQRVLSEARLPRGVGVIPPILPEAPFAEYAAPAVAPGFVQAAFEPTPSVGGGGAFYPFVSPIIGGGGLISGGGGGGVVTPVVTPPVASVPEPTTWLTMMLGIGAIGMMLRRRKKVGAVPA